MMKKITALLLVLIIAALCFCGCERQQEDIPDAGGEFVIEPDDKPDGNTDDTMPEDGKIIYAEPFYELSMDEVRDLVYIADCATQALGAFSDAAQLSDEAMVFAAMRYRKDYYTVDENDQYKYVWDMQQVEYGIRCVFGPDAKLSADFASKDYSPFSYDAQANIFYRGPGGGGVVHFYFPFTCLLEGEKIVLDVIDLSDPLFLQQDDNEAYLWQNGAEGVTWDMLSENYSAMQHNIFVFSAAADGTRYLSEFSIENDKNITYTIM